jgi:hypothetical protein
MPVAGQIKVAYEADILSSRLVILLSDSHQEFTMRKLTLLAAMLAFFAVAVYAGQASSAAQSDNQTSAESSTAKPPLKTIAGTISQDGKTFTPDKGSKEWTIKNPEDVKGHEGHHVKLQAHVYKDTNELHVMKVTMLNQKAGKKSKASSSDPSSY